MQKSSSIFRFWNLISASPIGGRMQRVIASPVPSVLVFGGHCSCGTVLFLEKTFFVPANLLCFFLCRALAMSDCYNNGPWKVMPSFIRCPLIITLPCLWSRGTLFPYLLLRKFFMCSCVGLSECMYVCHVCASRVQKRVSAPLELELRVVESSLMC